MKLTVESISPGAVGLVMRSRTRRKSELGSCQPNFFLYMKPSSRESDRTGRADRELRQPAPSCHLPTSNGGYFALLSLDVREKEAKHLQTRILYRTHARGMLGTPDPATWNVTRGEGATAEDPCSHFWFERGRGRNSTVWLVPS